MAATRPNQLRRNIHAARAEIQAVQQRLLAHEKTARWGVIEDVDNYSIGMMSS